MMTRRMFGNIQSVSELNQLQEEASRFGLTAIGVSDSGGLFKYQGFSALKVTFEEAKVILDVTNEELNEIIKFRGKFEILEEKFVLSTQTAASKSLENLPNNLKENLDQTPKEVEQETNIKETKSQEIDVILVEPSKNELKVQKITSKYDDSMLLTKEEFQKKFEKTSKAVSDGFIEVKQEYYYEILDKVRKYDELVEIIKKINPKKYFKNNKV